MKVQKLHSNIRSKLQSGLIITDVTQCVLELVENSLDAKATAIAVRIKLSKYEIEVLDNGVGISKNDLDIIGSRFMTSKCHEASDLNNTVFTYGFRGQALASLLDVCQILTIKTKLQKNNSILIKVFKNGNPTSFVVDCKEKSDSGTSVTVSDFMFSMPVRRKRMAEVFDLKEVKTQLEYLAIIHNQVCFTLRDEDKGVVLLQTKKTLDAGLLFADLFGSSIHSDLSVNHKEGDYEIKGFISLKRYSENNLQLLYINKRIIFKTSIHKFINSLIDQYFEKYRSSGNESIILNGFCSNIPKNRHNAYVIQIYCPYSYFEFFSSFKKRSVEFFNWDDLFNFIRNGIRRVSNLSKNRINIAKHMNRKKSVNLTNLGLENTLHESRRKTMASDASTEKKIHCNKRNRTGNLKTYFNDSLELKIRKNRRSCYLQNKFIAKDMKKLFFKIMAVKYYNFNVTNSLLVKKFKKVMKSLSKLAILKRYLIEVLKISDLNHLPTIKKKKAKKLKLFLIMCFLINFAICLNFEAEHNLKAFSVCNEFAQRKVGKLFGLLNVKEMLKKKMTDVFFKWKDKLHDVKDNVCENKCELGRGTGMDFIKMLLIDTSLKSRNKNSQNINYMYSEKNSCKISRNINTKLSVKDLFHESEKDSMKPNNITANVEELNKFEEKREKVFHEVDETSKFFFQKKIFCSRKCCNIQFFQRDELFERANDHGFKLTSDVDEITTRSLISHCRNRNSLISNVKNNLRTISDIMLNNMTRKGKKKGNLLKRKKMSIELKMRLFNFLKFYSSLKYSSFKHYLFPRKMRYFNLFKDAQIQAKILKTENSKQMQAMFDAFPVKKLNVAVQTNRDDVHLVTCENLDTEYRFHKNKIEIKENKEIKLNDLSKRANLDQPKEYLKTVANNCRSIKNALYRSNELFFNTIQSKTPSKLTESRTLLEATNVFAKAKMLDSNNLCESIANVKKSFILNSKLQTSNNSVCAISTNEIDILSKVITKVFSSRNLNVNKRTQYIKSITKTSCKSINGLKESENEKFTLKDLPITVLASKEELTNSENRFSVSERYSFIPKGLSQTISDKNPISLCDDQSWILFKCNCQKFKGNFCKFGPSFMNIMEPKTKSLHNDTGSLSNSAFEVNIIEDLYLKSQDNLIHYENQIIKTELSKSALKVHNLSNSFAISKDIFQNLKIIGQWDRKFIIATMTILNPYKMQILTVFDQHAVDERIQLEKLMQGFRNSDGKFISISCDPPIKCMLSQSDVHLIPFLENRLMESGIEVSVLDSQTIKFHKIPLCLVEKEDEYTDTGKLIKLLRSLIRDIIQEFIETRGTVSNVPKVLHNIISMKACKKAIKFNQSLSLEVMNKTIVELFECQFPFQCAHGRPTILPVLNLLDFINMEQKQNRKPNFKQLKIRMEV